MPVYKAPLDDIMFILNDVIDAEAVAGLPSYEDVTMDAVGSVLKGAARFCEEVLLPINAPSDIEGCTFVDGNVRMPKGVRHAYKSFCEGGWAGVSCKPEFGGMGLPLLLNFAITEMVGSANMAFSIFPLVSHAAYNTIDNHASDELRRVYLPKLADGSWTGTMCLTEPQCGTDLGLIRTKAVSCDDGTYKIFGEKIFISGGDQDISENIVHLVLARLPDAVPGVAGLSLFLAPKIIPHTGDRNGVYCKRLENKMGIHASPTCAMYFDGAVAWRVGAVGKGASHMFTMVNEARMSVGLQGLGIAEVAYQNAACYAKTRLQRRALTGPIYPEKEADPIIVHPDIRQRLLTIRALTEGCRALALRTGREFDCAMKHPDEKVRSRSTDFVALMIPIIKSFTTDVGFEAANEAVQIFGGHGYIRDNGIEQFVRDARIAQIYEGTNGIQSLDLVLRKMTEDYGRLLRPFFHSVVDFLAREKDNKALSGYLPGFTSAFNKLQMASLYLTSRSASNAEEVGAGASDYLRIFALVAIGYMWLKMARAASLRLQVSSKDQSFYKAKIHTANFYFSRIMPQVHGHYRALISGARSIMDFPEESF